MKIAFFGVKSWEKEYLLNKSKVEIPESEVYFFEEILDQNHLPDAKDFDSISLFVDSNANASVLEQFPNLKLITARSTGYDNIDLEACKARGIVVATVPAYGENTVAEYAFALILTLSRKIYESCEQIHQTGSFSVEGLTGFDLQGKTLGVLGTGKIGRNVIRIAKGFEMKILAFDTFPNEEYAKTMNYPYVPMEELLKQSDIVTVHVPYLKETHHLINEAALRLMKKNAFIINTSRGAVIETEALVKALKEKWITGAGLDVLEEEGIMKGEAEFVEKNQVEGSSSRTVIANHVLIDLPNVIVTPHNAFNTQEALERILETTVLNIKSFITGSPTNLVK
jgi:D-lactate dehydrogenase